MILSLLASLFLACTFSFNANAQHTAFSKIPLDPNCVKFYEQAKQLIENIIKNGSQLNYQSLDNGIAKISSKCHFEYSAGAFDALKLIEEYMLVEYLLETIYTDYVYHPRGVTEDYRKNIRKEINQFYYQRFSKLNLDTKALKIISYGTSGYKKASTKLLENLHQMAIKENTLIPFGRFIFTGHLKRPFTTYDFQRDLNGKIVLNKNKQPVVVDGSYLEAVKKVFNGMKTIVEEYLKWSPGIIYGKDSFIYGMRLPLSKEIESIGSIRIAKEDYFSDQVVAMWHRAIQLKIKLRPYDPKSQTNDVGQTIHLLKEVFFEMQQARIGRDMEVIRRIKIGVYSAPFVIGASGMAGLGFASMGASATVANNISAGLALLPMVAFSGMALKDYYQFTVDNKLPFKISTAWEHIVVAAVSSLPMSAILPVAVSGSSVGLRAFYLSSAHILHAPVTIETTRQALTYTAAQVPLLSNQIGNILKTPVTRALLKEYAIKWWFNKKMLVHIVIDNGASLVFQIGYRELMMENDQKFFLRDNQGRTVINDNAKYALARSAIFSFVGMPALSVKPFLMRFLTYRLAGATSGYAFLKYDEIFNGKPVNTNKVKFDFWYGLSTTPVNELESVVRFGTGYFDNADKNTKKKALLFLFSLSLKAFYTFPGNQLDFMDRYIKNRGQPGLIGELRDFYFYKLKINLDDYSDTELRAGLDQVVKNLDFQH